jgi:CCR4-NOT transcription complex subunit 9
MLQSHHAYPQQQHFPHPDSGWLNQQQQQHQQHQQHVGAYGMSQPRTMAMPTHPSPAPAPGAAGGMLNAPRSTITDEDAKVYTWIVELVQGDRRETALLELSKKREQVEDLAVILWHSVGQ